MCASQIQNLRCTHIEIGSSYAWLTPLKNHEEHAVLEKKLKEHLEAFGKLILIKKEKKYRRDKNAFGEGWAYKWNQDKKFTKNNYKTSNQDNVNKINDYSSDTPSNSSSSVSSHESMKWREKFNRKTKNEQQIHNRWSHHVVEEVVGPIRWEVHKMEIVEVPFPIEERVIERVLGLFQEHIKPNLIIF